MVTFIDGRAAGEGGRGYSRSLMAFIFVLSDEWTVLVNKIHAMEC